MKKEDVEKVSPILRDVLGVNEVNDAPVSGDTPTDPVGLLLERARYGIPAPVPDAPDATTSPLKKTLSLDELRAAVTVMNEERDDEEAFAKFPAMLEQSIATSIAARNRLKTKSKKAKTKAND